MDKYEYDWGTLSVEDHLIIGEMQEGEDIGVDVMEETFRLAEELFGKDEWGYISNRANSYSLHPIVYVRLKELGGNLAAYAAVLPSHKNPVYTETEKMVIDGFFEYAVFNSTDSARAWIQSILDKQ